MVIVSVSGLLAVLGAVATNQLELVAVLGLAVLGGLRSHRRSGWFASWLQPP